MSKYSKDIIKNREGELFWIKPYNCEWEIGDVSKDIDGYFCVGEFLLVAIGNIEDIRVLPKPEECEKLRVPRPNPPKPGILHTG